MKREISEQRKRFIYFYISAYYVSQDYITVKNILRLISNTYFKTLQYVTEK